MPPAAAAAPVIKRPSGPGMGSPTAVVSPGAAVMTCNGSQTYHNTSCSDNGRASRCGWLFPTLLDDMLTCNDNCQYLPHYSTAAATIKPVLQPTVHTKGRLTLHKKTHVLHDDCQTMAAIDTENQKKYLCTAST